MFKALRDFRIEHAGTEYSDYWQGVGVSCTKWDDVAIGVGSDGVEAYCDALNNVHELCGRAAGVIPDKCPEDIKALAVDYDTLAEESDSLDWGEYPNVYVAIYVQYD